MDSFCWVSATNIYNPLAYPTSNTTYTVTYNNIYGCLQSTSVTLNVVNGPSIGNLSINSSVNPFSVFDTLFVDVQLTNANDLYSLYIAS